MRLSHACIRAWNGLRSEYEPALGAFVLAMAALAIGIALTLVLTGTGLRSGWSVLALCCVAAISERGRIRLTSTTEESISLLPTLFAAVLFGPLAAMAVGAASLVTEIGQPPYLKWFTYTSTRALGGAATGLVSLVVLGRLGDDLGGIAVATTVGALVAQLLDIAFAVVVARLRGTRTPLDLIRTLAPLIVAWIPMYAPVVTLLALAYWQLSPLTLPLFFAPALVAQRMYVLYQEQRRLTVDVLSANEQLERANFSFATALVATLDARDRYTAGHSAAVAVYARDIAARMGLSNEQQQLVHLCGLVHDIGKVGLAAGLLEKPGPLTLDERRSMEKHSEIGERILANVDDYAEIASIVRHHHERVDGNGYPDALNGEEIPLLSRIIAVADAYNAMTSHRPYRDAMPSRVARLRLAQAVESQFDTAVVSAFESILTAASEEYRVGTSVEFASDARDLRLAPPSVDLLAASLSA